MIKIVYWSSCKVPIILARYFNLLTSNVNYSGRTAPLTFKVALYIYIYIYTYIQQIYLLNILNMLYTLRFFL